MRFDRMIMAWHRSNEASKRLHYIPGVGPMLATALVASVDGGPILRWRLADIEILVARRLRKYHARCIQQH